MSTRNTVDDLNMPKSSEYMTDYFLEYQGALKFQALVRIKGLCFKPLEVH